MPKKGIVVSLAFCLLWGVVALAVRGDQRPANAKPKVEYKAVLRTDIEAVAPEPVKKNGHREGSNSEALTEGLNVLAQQGWERIAIEPHSEQQTKTVQGTVTYHH